MASENSGGVYTFYPKFQEFVTLYRGVNKVWIGNGIDTGTAGMLYAQYTDDLVQQLGYVSDYEEAKKYFADLGIDLTYPEWVALLAATPENARKAESWAIGSISGVPVASTDPTYHNNSKYWNEQSHLWADFGTTGSPAANNNSKYWAEQSKSYSDGKGLTEQDIRPTDNSEYYKNQSKLWANNGVQGDAPNATNNSRYWAEQSKSYSDGKSLDDQTTIRGTDNAEYYKEEARQWVGSGEAHASATDNAIYYKNQAKLWANNGVQGDTPGANNNARYWAEQAKSYSDGKDLADTTNLRPTDNAEYYKNQSKLWANNGVQGDTPGASNNARYWAEQAKSYSDGMNLDDTTEMRPTDNAEYYKNQSKLWANNGVQGDAPGASNNSRYWAEQAKSYSDGKGLDERDIRTTDNAEYYKEEARQWAGSSNAHASATDNAKYWNDNAHLWVNFGNGEGTPSVTNNARSYALSSEESNLESESWAKGTRNGQADNVRSGAATDNSKYYSNESNLWANFGTDGEHATATTNAKYYSQQAHLDNISSAEHEQAAEDARDLAESYRDTTQGYMQQAYESQQAAAESETNAKDSEDAAAASETAAATSEANALDYKDRAVLAETNARNSELDAEAAQAAAEAAQSAAEQAQEDAEDARDLAEQYRDTTEDYMDSAWEARQDIFDARDAAQQAAGEAATSEANAATSSNYAAQARTAAETANTQAQAARTASEAARDRAETAATNAHADAQSASSSSTSAQTANTAAQTAMNRAEAAVDKYPFIGSVDYMWRVWNSQTGSWTITDVDARGLKGEKGDKGDPGTDGVLIDIGANDYTFYVRDDGYLILVYGGSAPPDFYINNDGYLVHVFDDGGED